jgi:hypothetical protein
VAITLFQPEVWSAQILSILAKHLVYGGSPCVNRDYEGEISAFGDTVHIPSVADVSIVDYTKDTDLTIQTLTDTEQLLLINRAKAFAFEIDDIDMRQVRSGGALMSEAASRAAFGLRDEADKYLAGLMASGAGNTLGVVDASSTATNVYDQLLVPASVKLDQANVPTEGRFIVLDPAAYGKLLLDSRFIKQNESGTSMGLRNGIVGEAAGFTVMKSNNAPASNRTVASTGGTTGQSTVTAAAGAFNQGDVGLSVAGTGVGASAKVASVSADGGTATLTVNNSGTVSGNLTLSGGGQVAIAGTSLGCSYAEQIGKVEAFRPPLRFADALKGLHLYGAKVVRPASLVVSSVKVA